MLRAESAKDDMIQIVPSFDFSTSGRKLGITTSRFWDEHLRVVRTEDMSFIDFDILRNTSHRFLDITSASALGINSHCLSINLKLSPGGNIINN